MRVSIFIVIIIHGRKTIFSVESSDCDIRKLGNVVSEITKTTTKYEPES